MRKITRIFVHCTASWQSTTTEASLIEEFKRKGWRYPGYHFAVFPNGHIFKMLGESYVANGVQGYNANSIHVAWVGGIKYSAVDKSKVFSVDNRTPEQRRALYDLLTKLKLKYRDAIIMGHRDISPDLNHNGVVDPWERIKDCPVFNAYEEYEEINKLG